MQTSSRLSTGSSRPDRHNGKKMTFSDLVAEGHFPYADPSPEGSERRLLVALDKLSLKVSDTVSLADKQDKEMVDKV